MKHLKQKVLFGSSALFGGSAIAAVPAGIDTAFTTASTDAVTVVGYIAVALVALIASYWILKAIRSGR